MADSIALGLRLGTATEHANFAGIEGEITINETDHRAVVHDGVTKGGYPMAKKSEVDGAIQTANSASSTASAAQTAANEAKNTASSAVTTANGAVTTANAAKTSAESAVSTANTANTNASSAKTSAQNAVSTANTAKTTAEGAVSTANTAKSTADTAKSTADSALSVANSSVKKVNGQTPNASGEVTISTVTNATNATKATQDASGNVITSTYLTKTEASSSYLGKTAKATSASTADNATKASQDGSGNVITSTYATKTEVEAAKSANGVGVGTILWWTSTTIPTGFLICDGAAYGRATYPDLFAAIGTTYGSGDGSTTFNVPNLLHRFAQGATTPGAKIEPGLPNITGSHGGHAFKYGDRYQTEGAYYGTDTSNGGAGKDGNVSVYQMGFDASRSSPIYGASTTVQPPALTLVPIIKAFGSVVNEGLLDASKLANDVANCLPKGGAVTNGSFNIGNDELSVGTNPTAAKYTAVYFVDSSKDSSAAHRMGVLEHSVSTAGQSAMKVGAYQWVAGKTSFIGAMLDLRITSAGVATGTVNGAFSATSVQATSDERLKSDIESYTADISSLGTYKYVLNSEKRVRVGLIAQEVEKAIPDAVSIGEDGYYALDYNAIVAVLVGKVNELEARLKKLEG